jgi:hypothetical protein
VNVPARTACEPGSNLGMLVDGVVVDDEMDVKLGWHVGLVVTQEGEEPLMEMAGFALGDDRAVKHVEGGEQRGRARHKSVEQYREFEISRPRTSLVAKRFNHFTPGNGMKLRCVNVVILDQETPKLAVV